MEHSDTQAALDAGTLLAGIKHHAPTGASFPLVILPKDAKVTIPDPRQAEAWLDKPLRKRGDFRFATVESFIRYVNEQKQENTRIFADIGDADASFSATLDFHGKEASFNEHTCTMALRSTHEWNVWIKNNGVSMTQTEFAAFLEENADMFTTPSGADLLELVQTLEGKCNVAINSGVKMQTRAVKLSYTEEVVLRGISSHQSGDIEIPQILNASIAPFEGVAPQAVKARLRYRIADKKVTFFYQAVDTHLVVRAVCDKLVDTITKQTGLEPFKV